MALTIIDRPLGHKVTIVTSNRTISNHSGDAGFTDTLSLSTGDYIYIIGNVENYNGFWYVDKSSGIVYLKTNANSDRVDFIVETNVIVYKTVSHKWNAAHLPIVYKIKSDIYPVNSVDPIAGNVTLYGFTGPYMAFNHDALSGGDALVPFDKILMYGDNGTTKVFTVLDVISTTRTLLDSNGNDAPGGTSFVSLQKYRNNYHAIVNIYSGLESGHAWNSVKPMELASTLKFIPDQENEIALSVNEILKSYLEIVNNTLLATLPNNIDFFTMFYITVQEAYDESDGEEVTVHYGTEQDDSSFTGVACNSILEFKNRYSGSMSEYLVDSDLTGAKFLTLFNTPTIFDGKYFDISFITNFNEALTLRKNWVDKDGNIIYTSDELVTYYDKGLYRLPLTIDHGCTFVNEHPPVYEDATIYLYSEFTTNLDGWTQPNSGATIDDWFWDDSLAIYSKYATRLQQTQDSLAQMNHDLTSEFPPGTQLRIRTRFSGGVLGTYTLKVYGIQIIPTPWLILTSIQTPLQSEKIVDEIITLPVGGHSPPYNSYNAVYFTIEGGMSPGNQVYVDYFIVESVSAIVTPGYTSIDPLYLNLQVLGDAEEELSEVKQLNLNCKCSKQSLYLTWLNNLGGFDYWDFTDGSDFTRNIIESGETKKNIFPNWPNSYGENASEIRKQTYKVSNKGIIVRAQHLTLDELQAVEYIKSSILVEIMTSRSDKRRVILDNDSWVSYKGIDKLYTLSFTLQYTNDIPSQRL